MRDYSKLRKLAVEVKEVVKDLWAVILLVILVLGGLSWVIDALLLVVFLVILAMVVLCWGLYELLGWILLSKYGVSTTGKCSGPHNIAALTYGERLVLDVTVMMGEVLNGGFHQYLWNSSGDSAQHVRSMLKDIGAIRTADMLDRISGSFPQGPIPEEREERWRIIEELETENPGVELFVEEDRPLYALLTFEFSDNVVSGLSEIIPVIIDIRHQQQVEVLVTPTGTPWSRG